MPERATGEDMESKRQDGPGVVGVLVVVTPKLEDPIDPRNDIRVLCPEG